jgi:AbrB family looped-hinge helix DNA binding protein
MNVTRIIDDIGRVAIPKDIRRSFRWMGGDEIEIIPDEKEGTILLRQYHNDTALRLEKLREEWVSDPEITAEFDKLIEMIQNKN